VTETPTKSWFVSLAGSVSKQLEFAIEKLKAGLVERDTEARLMLLAALSGEHILFIGPPGTAKSELGRRLSFLCKGGSFFERLLTRFTVPEVITFFMYIRTSIIGTAISETERSYKRRFSEWTSFTGKLRNV
jgi:MoxR-like ATPase